MNDKRLNTYELDNVALIYQALVSKKESHFFRLSLNLQKPVVIDILQQALLNILPRFPIFRTSLKRGIFWNYLEENFHYPTIIRDTEIAMGHDITQAHAYPFRVLVYHQRISLETTHLIVDGKAATQFLQSLFCEYAYLLGVEIPDNDAIIRPETPLQSEELHDAYKNLLLQKALPKPKKRMGEAFYEPQRNRRPFGVEVVSFRLPLDQTLQLAKQHKVSLTTLLTAFYLTAYQDRMFLLPPKRKFRRPLRINNPVDLRQFFPSKSLRNFIGFISHEIDPRLGLFTFEEILAQVHHTMKKELLDKHFQPFIGQNLRSESIPLLAVIPLFMKRMVLKRIHAQNMRQESSVLSNLGAFSLPEEVASMVKDVEFIPAPKYINKRDCSVISFKNTLILSISRTCKHNQLEQFLYERLIEAGLTPKLSTYHGYEQGEH
ncbi:hypothetical protein [Entomospira culicis]|uniref:Alcohol acetyltransferase n=1 Tax=Entomospira culicis TaxID=2719989 RepID=A0A968GFP5_9SPIO|nr:hypothetical protein [Entomospira culicis]NIZ19411.1 hypothetical protein [Entomospira culicis]NIZ69684.1 hypothetical protein [Entomospira culicis]WDI36794.1 hypothetical protein PVA46_05570 [Entomospira culicis]WDI38423.1 hypothetical protein PVA47_05580 [Entomospira culicis]